MAALRVRILAGVMRFGPIPARSMTLWIVLVMLALGAGAARAQIGSDRYSSIVIDAATGNVLSAVNADAARYPASLTKMMTLYMTFEALRDRRVTLATPVPVSAHSASMSPSKLGLVPGTRLTVEQAILGLVTKSANDAASALGELLGGGDEAQFAQMMTLRAHALGMTHTTFRNASGLPDPQQTTTARDLALLARHLIRDFPDEYHYFSVPYFIFHGRTILNHDHLLQRYPGADGMKTGYTQASGFNLVTSAVRDNVRLIGVVIGAARPGARDQHMEVLLDRGFEAMNVPIGGGHEYASHGGGLIASAQAATLESAQITAVAHEHAAPRGWALQTGSFSRESSARAAIALVTHGGNGDVHVERVGRRHHPRYRAVLLGLSQAEARGDCGTLARHHYACSVLRSDSRQFASR